MLNKINIGPDKQKIIVYIVLTVVTLAVYWQVNQYGFVIFDDPGYITHNNRVKAGITADGIRWCFSSKFFDLWHPLIWISWMLDYQLYGLNAGGYHLTSLVLHILSTLLLFWLFCRMTGAVWKSAFVAAFFALHPLHVESVVWISERKDVLSAFFWMLTLCFYVWYTEKPVGKRYALVLFSFVLALMSKPMVVTLPVIMILLDYWPLGRFGKQKGNMLAWQLKEKLPLFILSAALVIITLYTPDLQETSSKSYSLASRLANAPVAFVTYLIKTFWPYDMAVYYPFSNQIPVWKVLLFSLFIVVVSAAAIVKAKRLPQLFAGWMWYVISILPVIGIIQIWLNAMADHYTYLPSIGISAGLVWGVPLLFPHENMRKNILFPAGAVIIAVLAIVAWQQCKYWKDSKTMLNHTLQITKDNAIALMGMGLALYADGQTEEAIGYYNKAIGIKSVFINSETYNTLGIAYAKIGKYQKAVDSYNESMRLKSGDCNVYLNRGQAYDKMGRQQLALEDYNKAIQLRPDYTEAFNNRGSAYIKLGQYQKALDDFNKAIKLNDAYFKAYCNRGSVYYKMGRYLLAIDDYSKAIKLKKDYTEAYNNRGVAYFAAGNRDLGCRDAQTVCSLGNCKVLEWAKSKGNCN